MYDAGELQSTVEDSVAAAALALGQTRVLQRRGVDASDLFRVEDLLIFMGNGPAKHTVAAVACILDTDFETKSLLMKFQGGAGLDIYRDR